MSAFEFYKRLSVTGVVVAVVAVAIAAPTTVQSQAKDGCESSCGNVSIPFPFGTSKNCSLDEQFLVVCNRTLDPPMATLSNYVNTFQVIGISLTGEMIILNQRAMVCYDSVETIRATDTVSAWMQFGRYRISSTKNKFTVLGCGTMGLITSSHQGKNYGTGCFAFCNNITDVTNGSCDGVGCCQSRLPLGAQDYSISLSRHTYMYQFNPCDYGFIVQDGRYSFPSVNLFDLRQTKEFPMVLDWSVGNQTCQKARRKVDYACRGNSICEDADNASGYRCFCRDGYSGNPYLRDCIQIDQCQSSNNCDEKAICENKRGEHTCSCPKGYRGDGFKKGSGCTPNQKNYTTLIVGLSISTSFLALLSVGLLILWGLKRRKLQQLRQKYFRQNGGTMLLQQLSSHDGSTNATKIFTEEDLKKATKDFHESRIIGQGGQGTVYKGILTGDRVVAVKKARIGDESQVKDFVNEVALLFNVSHKNVVKLLGCCFETQVPTLIYEYVSHGSLLDHLKMAETTPFPWELRLKIATETAEALWYLHFQVSTPIIHRDIKSANILLDKNYTAKVSDFGASRLVQQDNESQKDNTAVQGTIGYLDPEYIITQQLNEKSDVYSFGVVLVELLAGISVIDFRRNNPSKSLVDHVLSSLKSDRLAEVSDPQIAIEKNMKEVKAVAVLARSCVSVSGEERPTMKQVFSVLEGLRPVKKTRIVEDGGVDIHREEYLLGDFSDATNDGDTSGTAGCDNMMAQLTFDTTKAR